MPSSLHPNRAYGLSPWLPLGRHVADPRIWPAWLRSRSSAPLGKSSSGTRIEVRRGMPGIARDKWYYLANLCRLLPLPEFPCFCGNLGEPIGEAAEEATVGSWGKRAAEHFQNVLSDMQGIE